MGKKAGTCKWIESSEKLWRELITEGDNSQRYFRALKDKEVFYLEGAKYLRDHLQILYDTLKFEKGDKVRIASGRVNRAGRRADQEGTIIMVKGYVYFVEYF